MACAWAGTAILVCFLVTLLVKEPDAWDRVVWPGWLRSRSNIVVDDRVEGLRSFSCQAFWQSLFLVDRMADTDQTANGNQAEGGANQNALMQGMHDLIAQLVKAQVATAAAQEALMKRLEDKPADKSAEDKPRQADKVHRVTWKDLQKLDLHKPLLVDAWLMTFESRMRAHATSEAAWGQLFEECPFVPEAAKRLKDEEGKPVTDYPAVRRAILAKYGPTAPMQAYELQLFKVKGTTIEEVRDKLNSWLELYNRACDDADKEKHKKGEDDLLYLLCEAFPADVSRVLYSHLKTAAKQGDPFEHLAALAPTRAEGQQVTFSELERLGQTVPPRPTPGAYATTEALVAIPRTESPKRKASVEILEGPLLALVDRMERALGRMEDAPSRKVMRIGEGSCSGCGRSCRDRSECPAQGQTCHKCNRLHHFARMCRNRSGAFGGMPGSGANMTERKQADFQRGGPRAANQ